MSTAQDTLVGALVGLCRAAENNPKTPSTDRLLLEGLAASSGDDALAADWTVRIREEKYRVSPGCAACAAPCGNTDDYDLSRLADDPEELRLIKTVLLAGLRRGAVQLCTEAVTPPDEATMAFVQKGLCLLPERWQVGWMLPLLVELSEWNARLWGREAPFLAAEQAQREPLEKLFRRELAGKALPNWEEV